jgi:hypothetical protein
MNFGIAGIQVVSESFGVASYTVIGWDI